LKTLPAFSQAEFFKAHALLASRVAKGLPDSGWSNLNIDVMHGSLGVEHKMLCVRSDVRIKEHCGTSLMHPSATRSIRIPSTEGDATEIARDVLRQYAELIE
jgi:hypothetical protein